MTDQIVDNLPDKLSDLITVAIRDLIKCMKQKDKYDINMDYWHVPNANGYTSKCSVCLAGSVMAQTLGADITKNMDPDDFGVSSLEEKLLALNDVRLGDISAALYCMHQEYNEEEIDKYERNLHIIDFYDDPAGFIEFMLEVSNDLKEMGY